MKKITLLILAAALTLGAFQNVRAAGRTSANLSTTSNLIDNVTTPDSGIPMGSVINWPYSWMPADAENWRECNGQSLAGTTLCKEKGQCVAPNYQGVFLRGYGGNSGALGALQNNSVYIPPEANISISLKGIRQGYAVVGHGTAEGGGSGTGTWDVTADFKRFIDIGTGRGKEGGPFLGLSGYDDGEGVYHGNADDGQEFKASIKGPEKETRPANKAIRYLIKVN